MLFRYPERRRDLVIIKCALDTCFQIFRHSIAQVQQQLDELLAENAEKDARVQAVIDKAKSFMYIHRNRCKQANAASISSNSNNGSSSSSSKNQQVLETLSDTIARLTEMSEDTLVERSNSMLQKKQAMAVLHRTKTQSKFRSKYAAKLETEFVRSDQPIEDELEAVTAALESAEATTARLQDRPERSRGVVDINVHNYCIWTENN